MSTSSEVNRNVNDILPPSFFNEQGEIIEEYEAISAGLAEIYNEIPDSSLTYFEYLVRNGDYAIPTSTAMTPEETEAYLDRLQSVMDNIVDYLRYAGGSQELVELIIEMLARLSDMAAKIQMFNKVESIEMKLRVRNKEERQADKQFREAFITLATGLVSAFGQLLIIGLSESANYRSFTASKSGLEAEAAAAQPVNTDQAGEPDAPQANPAEKNAEAKYYHQRSQMFGQLGKVVATIFEAIQGSKKGMFDADMKKIQAAITELQALASAFNDRLRNSDKNQDQLIQIRMKMIELLIQLKSNEVNALRVVV